jgi:hypothetical protein
MIDYSPMPDPEKVKQTVDDSRRRRLEMEVVGLELEEVIAKLEQHNRQQRLKRLKQLLGSEATEPQFSEQKSLDILS